MSWEEDARRVAEIFGVPAGQRLPAVSRQTLRHYHTYLTAHLVFPFHAAIPAARLKVLCHPIISSVRQPGGCLSLAFETSF